MTQAIDEHDLLHRLRNGNNDAFEELYEQHAPAVRRLALSMAKDRAEAEDITAETFFRVLRAIKRGSGPTDTVRGYLLTVARRVAWEWHGAAHDVPVSDDELSSRVGATESTAVMAAEHALMARAFTSLPDRWRRVLWRTEVEGAQPAAVAGQFGLSPNATAALARRARQGLRAAYLQAHLGSDAASIACKPIREKLGGYTAGNVSTAEARRISMHLGSCASCRSTHDELRDVCFSLRSHAGVISLAVPAAAANVAGSGMLSAMKGAVTGVKVKVGVAVASTAAVGVLAVGAGTSQQDARVIEAVDIHGNQGVPMLTIERLPEPALHTPIEPADVEPTVEPEPAEPDAAEQVVTPVEPAVAVEPQDAPEPAPVQAAPSTSAAEPTPEVTEEPERAEPSGRADDPEPEETFGTMSTADEPPAEDDNCEETSESGVYYDQYGNRYEYEYHERTCTY